MKKNWFSETIYPDISLTLKNKSLLFRGRSLFQDIKIFETKKLGRVLAFGGVIQTTEKDGFVYHEMLTHVPIVSHPKPRRIVIIGGGNGGVLREALKHPIEVVYLVEIDKKVIELSRKYLKKICKNSFDDKRVQIINEDGASFVKKFKNYFDVVIIDSPDPIRPATVLSKANFFKDTHRSLTKNGIMVCQSGSSFFQSDGIKLTYKRLKKVFSFVDIYGINVPTHIGGIFNVVVASKGPKPHESDFFDVHHRFKKYCSDSKYYNPRMHFCSFTLPTYIHNVKKG